MGAVSSNDVEIHGVTSTHGQRMFRYILEWDGFEENILRRNFCRRWHVNTG
jgi:hypothetical protein